MARRPIPCQKGRRWGGRSAAGGAYGCVIAALVCARSRGRSTGGRCQVHRRYLAGRWRPVSWPAGHGRGTLGGCTVRLLRSVRSCRSAERQGGKPETWVSVRIGFTAPVSTGNPCRTAKMAARTGFPRCDDVTSLSCRLCVQPSAATGPRTVTCPAEDGIATIEELDTAGLSWTCWDMIQNLRRADLAHSGATDATRTERGFHAARNGVSAGQWLFRWAGIGSL